MALPIGTYFDVNLSPIMLIQFEVSLFMVKANESKFV